MKKKIDRCILEIVKTINQKGYKTFCSCEGHYIPKDLSCCDTFIKFNPNKVVKSVFVETLSEEGFIKKYLENYNKSFF
jgi:hypothetical protein